MECCRERFVDRCCFCIELRTGLIIYGVINLVFQIFRMAAYAFFHHEDVSTTRNTIEYILYAVYFTLCIVFIYGAVRRIARIIKMYYIFLLIFVVLIVALAITSIILDSSIWLSAVGFSVLFMLWHLYGFVICRSYYKKLKNTAV